MIIRRLPQTTLFHSFNLLRTITTAPPPSQLQLETTISSITPVNPDQLRRVCTILYQQQNSPESRLNSKLSSYDFQLNHEFFLQVCNNFNLSWTPVYRFHLYTLTNPHFSHNSVTYNKMLDVIGKSRNIDLFWEIAQEIGRKRLANDTTFRIVLKTLASARELKKCVIFFRLMNDFGYEYNVERLNKVVETLCCSKLIDEAKFVVFKLKEWIKPNGITYKLIVKGFCDTGELIEASKLWNLMVDEGFNPDVDSFEKMMEILFKNNQYHEAMNVLQMVKTNRIDDLNLSTYRLAIDWLCRRRQINQAQQLLDEMRQRGIKPDNPTLSSILYALITRRLVNSAYELLKTIETPDISIYHGFIKGLLVLKRPNEATKVFREMINKGCEPIMHTYVMLLQGHMGKSGIKGKDPLVNFDSIFVGGLVKVGKSLEASKYVERSLKWGGGGSGGGGGGGFEVARFDYNRFLHYYSSEEGVVMFEEVGKKLREVGLVDLAYVFERYGEKMATRERRRNRANG